ncbi:MAG: hypothetical protein APR63_05185 [Desulfuromonas sp. SDB]|nr:MAG: hypothetical protein APR63_05185 [Desulfuromonas sp. SDB]
MKKIMKEGLDYYVELIRYPLHLIGEISIFIYQSVKAFEKPRVLSRLTIEQMFYTGIQSLPIIIVSSAAIGLVTVFQAEFQSRGIMPKIYISTALVKATLEELGPLLTGLMLSGRVGASMSAELGTMKVTEQIDALAAMAINPYRYLALPRIIAVTLITPMCTAVAELTAILSGFMLATLTMDIPAVTFLNGMKISFYPVELFGGLLKSLIFGIIIGISGTFSGFHAEGGAKGVGDSTTRAVVAASVLILFADYFVARLVFK